MALGSLVGGKIILNGKRRVLIVCNIVSIVASLLTLFHNWPLMLVGRAFFGFASGVIVVTAPKYLDETIPSHLMDYGFGASTNTIICLAMMISMLLGIGYPTSP